MDWRLKLLVQGAAGLSVPTSRFYTFATTEILRSRSGEPGKWCQSYPKHVQLLREHANFALHAKRGWCIDTGFTITAPLLIALSGASAAFTGRRYSFRGSYNDDAFAAIALDLDRLRPLLRITTEDERRVLSLRGALDVKAVLRELSSRYVDASSRSSFAIENDSVDFVMSMGALEHYGPAELDALLAEMVRISKPGAVFSHIVDHRDHSYHAQQSIGPLNHLRFSDRAWSLMARPPFSYTNRMLHSDFVSLFERRGLEILHAGWEPHGTFGIDERAFNPRFRGRSDVDYKALVSYFILRVPE